MSLEITVMRIFCRKMHTPFGNVIFSVCHFLKRSTLLVIPFGSDLLLRSTPINKNTDLKREGMGGGEVGMEKRGAYI